MRLFKKLLLSILILLLFYFLFISFGYIKWEKETFSQDKKVTCLTDINESDLDVSKKIEEFTTSNNKTEFITFTKKEIIGILKSNIQVGESVQLENICILPSKGIWSLYLKYKAGRVAVPWIILDIVKDDRETAEIYVKEMYLGKYGLPTFLSNNIVVQINKGISDALILVNENGFLGRDIKNIELLEERVVIKGSL